MLLWCYMNDYLNLMNMFFYDLKVSFFSTQIEVSLIHLVFQLLKLNSVYFFKPSQIV